MSMKNKKFQSSQAEKIINQAMEALGLKANMSTDPGLMKALLCQFKLDDFEAESKVMRQFFEAVTQKPQPLDSFFEVTKKGLMTKQPAVLDFLEEALSRGWLVPFDHSKTAVHVAFIFEALTAAMANNNSFLIDIQDHFLKKRGDYGLKTNSALHTFWKIRKLTGSSFDGLKTVSVDPGITYFRFRRAQGGKILKKDFVKMLYQAGQITFLDYKLLCSDARRHVGHVHAALITNIYEAGTVEYKEGVSEALAAHALCEEAYKHPHPQRFSSGSVLPEQSSAAFYTSLLDPKNTYPTTDFDSEWIALYHSWNSAFVLNEFDDLPFLLPKLYIPSVVDAKPENYLFTRVIALWLAINLFLFRRLDGVQLVKGPDEKKEMASLWRDINKKYAVDLSKNKTHVSRRQFQKSFKENFSHPLFHLIQLALKI